MVLRRRNLAVAFGALLAVPSSSRSQSPGRGWRVGLLSDNPLADPAAVALWGPLQSELQRLAAAGGHRVAFELRAADGAAGQLPRLARETVDSGVDLIVAAGTAAALAALEATAAVPIVFVSVPDPLAAGVVRNLVRPGGNVTGIADSSRELVRARLELLRDVASGARRIGYLTTAPGSAGIEEDALRVAAALRLSLLPVAVSAPEDLPGAIDLMPDAEAWFVADSLRVFGRSDVVAPFADQARPVVYPNSTFVWAGGLMSCGASALGQARRAAWYVDRILRGAQPGTVPVEPPAQFETVVNLRVARAQNIAIPQPVLQRADEVIE